MTAAVPATPPVKEKEDNARGRTAKEGSVAMRPGAARKALTRQGHDSFFLELAAGDELSMSTIERKPEK
jgi:hypothetical protein